MSRISDAFAKEKAFIPFITGGDPDLETSYELIKTMKFKECLHLKLL